MKRRLSLILILVAVGLCLNLYPDQTPRAQGKQPSPQSANPAAGTTTITGKVIKEPDGYFIQGETPLEIFRILNPNPKILDKIVKSGRSAKIEAQSIQGDNVIIEKIDGQAYQEEKGSKK